MGRPRGPGWQRAALTRPLPPPEGPLSRAPRLVAFDLDLVLTSDHEWCDYRELTGIAIHQLTTGTDGDDAVTTVRFTWDGHSLKAED